mgnify:FL=1
MKQLLFIFLTSILFGCNENKSNGEENNSVSEKSIDNSDSINNENSSYHDSITTTKNDTITQEFISTKDSISENIIKNEDAFLKMTENDFNEFEIFITGFINDLFYNEKQFNYLVYNDDPIFLKYIHNDLGYHIAYNMGASCDLYPWNSYFDEFDYFAKDGMNDKNKNVKPKNLKLFRNEMPIYGFCDPSESPDGLYYKQIGEIVYYNNYDSDEIINEEPEIIKNAFKIEVYNLSNGYVTPLYFVKIDEKWHFHIISKCDCGA